MRRPRSTVLAALAVTGLLLAGCGSDDGDDVSSDDTAAETTATTAAPASEPDSGSSDTTEADDGDGGEGGDTGASEPTTSDTTEPDDGSDPGSSDPSAGLSPGDPCSLEEGVPDCIDPDGDGEGTYLEGGADCIAGAVDPSICEDLDGDGTAGYPDEYEELPTCGPDVAPPCNNPDDPDAEDQG